MSDSLEAAACGYAAIEERKRNKEWEMSEMHINSGGSRERRLNDELLGAREVLTEYDKLVDALRAENERLREALRGADKAMMEAGWGSHEGTTRAAIRSS